MIKVADENRKTKNKIILLCITIISIFIICRLAIGIYQSMEVGVKYNERIMQCEITENEITYKVNGLSIIHTKREIVIYR